MKEQLVKTQKALLSLNRKNELERNIANDKITFTRKKLEKQQAIVEELRTNILANYKRLDQETQQSGGLDVERYQQILAYIEVLQLKLKAEDERLNSINEELNNLLDEMRDLHKEKNAFDKKMSDTTLTLNRELAKDEEFNLADIWLNKELRND